MVNQGSDKAEDYCYQIIKECLKELQLSLKLNLENTQLLCHMVLARFSDEFLMKYTLGVPKNERSIETRDNMEKLFQKAMDLATRNLESDVLLF